MKTCFNNCKPGDFIYYMNRKFEVLNSIDTFGRISAIDCRNSSAILFTRHDAYRFERVLKANAKSRSVLGP